MANYIRYLDMCLLKYKYKDATKKEVLEVLKSYEDLRPEFQEHVFDDGSFLHLLSLEGNIPIQYQGSTYNIPICMFLVENYPLNPPICYVRPTYRQVMRPGKHVDIHGRVHMPCLDKWKHDKSDLIGVIEAMREVFGKEPPVAAKPNLHVQPQIVNGELTLNLEKRGLRSIPQEVFDIIDLHVLNVSNNRLTSIPEDICYLEELNKLYAENNMLTKLPDGICLLANLASLMLGNNKLSTLPPGIQDMQNLVMLGLDGNRLTEIPHIVCSLPYLKVLGVHDNMLFSLPPELGKLQKLTHLFINGNYLKELPSFVEKFQELRHLHVDSNQLTKLPPELCSLSNLEKLVASNNRLSTLPPGIERMRKLAVLKIANNQLTEFPQAVCSLPELEQLDISNNGITRLPTTLSRARKLQSLDVRGNPLTYPPLNIHAKGVGAIMTFLEEAVKDKRLLQAFSLLSMKVTQTQLKPLARSVGLDKGAIDAVKTTADDLQDQVYLTLEKWKEKEGEAATLPELEQHLRYLDLHQLADGLLGVPMSPENRTFESEERGAFGGQDTTQPQSSKYPSVTVDEKFPVIEFEQLDFPLDAYLGHGGSAAVAKAHHWDWKLDVAVKCLLAQETEGSEQQLLYSEARKLKQASTSPYVISLLGVCLDPHFAIVMPYMENGSLASLLRDVDVPWALRWRMAHEISLGMTFLHCQNPQILHCDLKAENVLLDEDFHMKISDFGLSKWRTKSRIVTATSPTGATITHAPPEYMTDINIVPTDKFDVYSFGVLLWEIITRRKPYENAMNSALIELGVRTGQRPDMRLVPTDVPDLDTVSQLMQKCWSQEQDDRPSFQECADKLQGVKNKSSKENILEAIIYVQKEKLGKK